MQQIEPLLPGKFYHIYNRGINSCSVFTETTNFEHFLNLYDKYISMVADTFAWVLMKNHFHFLVRIKEMGEMQTGTVTVSGMEATEPRMVTLSGLKTAEREWVPNPSHQFSHLFNAYAQAFNKRNNRTGSLFEHPFKRKIIEDIDYFKTVVLYIHNNPVHHGVRQHAMDYPWSSYLTCISVKPTHLQRDAVIGWFNNQADFEAAHGSQGDIADLEKWLEL
jgi:REP element-mobilizing transposase RayT